MIITTASQPSPEVHHYANELSQRLEVPFVSRKKYTVRKMQHLFCEQILLVKEGGLFFHAGENPPLFYHPSMAQVRIKTLQKQGSDFLVKVSGVRKGDRVIDCTAGLAADTLVFSYIIGSKGHISACESSRVLATILSEGLKKYKTNDLEMKQALRRIQIINEDYETYLALLPSRSVDIIYFDPMFAKAHLRSTALLPLRQVANAKPLTIRAVNQALRVARRRIVYKGHKETQQFKNLGFLQVYCSTSVAYGIIDVE